MVQQHYWLLDFGQNKDGDWKWTSWFSYMDNYKHLAIFLQTVMDFKHPDGRTVAVVLPERSLLVMKGESRYLWTHGWETG